MLGDRIWVCDGDSSQGVILSRFSLLGVAISFLGSDLWYSSRDMSDIEELCTIRLDVECVCVNRLDHQYFVA